MKISVIGGGGREHAIIKKLLLSKMVEKVYWIGAKGKRTEPKVEMVNIDVLDFPSLVSFCKEEDVAYTIVGPELPLTEGIVDYFQKEGLLIFGPNKLAAQLEGSKTFAKEIMLKYGVPTAKYVEIDDLNHGIEIIKKWGTPIVFKVDGLAQGKGVIIPTEEEEAIGELKDLLERHPNQKIFAEEFFQGEEISYMVLVSNNQFLPLVPSRDYKRIFDGNKGPNTGGMGSVACTSLLTEQESSYIDENVIKKTLEGLKNEELNFTGILYAGLMLTPVGPKVLEFNTRFGDPETQSILALLQDDLAQLLYGASKGQLPDKLSFSQDIALTMVLAAGGYPGAYKTGDIIEGIQNADCDVYEAGTQYIDGNTLTAGGRVLNLTTLGKNVGECRETLYREQQKITFLGKYFRNDIGL